MRHSCLHCKSTVIKRLSSQTIVTGTEHPHAYPARVAEHASRAEVSAHIEACLAHGLDCEGQRTEQGREKIMVWSQVGWAGEQLELTARIVLAAIDAHSLMQIQNEQTIGEANTSIQISNQLCTEMKSCRFV